MAVADPTKPPPSIGAPGPFGRVFNGEKYVSKDAFAAEQAAFRNPQGQPLERQNTPQRIGGRSTATKPGRADLMAMAMNDKLPEGQEQRIASSDLGDPRMRAAGDANGEGAVVFTNEPPKYIQYDDWGIARRVNRSTYLEIKRAVDKDGHKLHDECPLCGGDHPETEWDPNACPARTPMSGFLCPHPSCGKECWPDVTQQVAVQQQKKSSNPAMKSLPMTEAMLEKLALTNLHEHVGTYHPSLARAMGLAVNALAYGGSGVGMVGAPAPAGVVR